MRRGGFQLRRDTGLACPVETNITFDKIDRDDLGFFDQTNPGQIVIPETGFYLLYLACKYSYAGDGHNGNNAYLRVNDSSHYYDHGLGYSQMLFIDRNTTPLFKFFQAGDVIEAYCGSVEAGATVQALFTGYKLG